MLDISKKLFESWNESGILYCHWKSNEHLNPGLEGITDLDVFISPKDADRGKVIMRELGFLECKSQYGSNYPDVEDWLGFDEETGRMIHNHLHLRLATGHAGLKEYSLPWAEEALRTRILNKEYGVYVMEPNLEIVTIYTRIGLKVSCSTIIKGLFGVYHEDKDALVEINWLKKHIEWDRVKSILQTYYGIYADTIYGLMQQERIGKDTLKKLRYITENVFSDCNCVGWKMRYIEFYYRIIYRYAEKIIKKCVPLYIEKKTPKYERGLTIAFLGQDGAGKTTVTTDIMKWLKWKLDVRYSYLGSGDNYSSWRKKLHGKLPNNIILKPLRVWLSLTTYTSLADDVLKHIVLGEEYASEGGIQIFDRYPQIEFCGINDGPKLRTNFIPKLPSKIQKFFLRYALYEESKITEAVSHYPNIVFKLILPPEESIRRKPFENLVAVQKKHEIIKSLKFEGSDVYTIDATIPYKEEILLIKKIIWEHIQK